MANNTTKNREAVKKMADIMRTVFLLSVLTNVDDVYRFVNTHGEIRQGIAIVLGIIGTVLIWQLSRALRAERKQALYYWFAIGMLGYTRWIFFEGTFNLNLFSIILFSLAIALTLRIVIWARNGVLT